MPPRTIKGAGFSQDILIFLRLLSLHRVRYVIVGGEAVIFHGYPRVTGDVDFFYDGSRLNSQKLFDALVDFWDGRIPGVRSAEELGEAGLILQFGRPPHRIDLMNRIDGVTFPAAWQTRIRVRLQTTSDLVTVQYIDLAPLLKNKRATSRPKDLEDAQALEGKVSTKRRRPRADR